MAGTRVDPPAKKKKNKQKNGGSNVVYTQSSNTESTAVPNVHTSEAIFGDIDKLKGDVLANGKSSIAIVSGLFSMEDDISKHKGRKVVTVTTEEEGCVDGSFGKMGKCKVMFVDGISAEIGSQVKMFPLS